MRDWKFRVQFLLQMIITDTYAVRRIGDTNTRLALPDLDEISLQNASGSILRIKDDRVGINSVTPRSELDVRGNVMVSGISTFVGVTTFSADVSVGVDTSVGVILTSPNGTAYRLVVANDGTLSTAAV